MALTEAQKKYKSTPEYKLKQAEATKKWRSENKDYFKEYFKDEEKLNKRKAKEKGYKTKCTKNDYYTVYKIQIDNNIYIGQTMSKLRIRKSQHRRDIVRRPLLLLYSWLKTVEDFDLEEITTVNTKKEALELETFYIKKYIDLGYNIFNTQKITTTKVSKKL